MAKSHSFLFSGVSVPGRNTPTTSAPVALAAVSPEKESSNMMHSSFYRPKRLIVSLNTFGSGFHAWTSSQLTNWSISFFCSGCSLKNSSN